MLIIHLKLRVTPNTLPPTPSLFVPAVLGMGPRRPSTELHPTVGLRRCVHVCTGETIACAGDLVSGSSTLGTQLKWLLLLRTNLPQIHSAAKDDFRSFCLYLSSAGMTGAPPHLVYLLMTEHGTSCWASVLLWSQDFRLVYHCPFMGLAVICCMGW